MSTTADPKIKHGPHRIDSTAGTEWPDGKPFSMYDDPDEHKPCYLVLPDGAAIPFNHHGVNGVNQAQVKWIMDVCNAALGIAPETSVCPDCGTDRFKGPCPKGIGCEFSGKPWARTQSGTNNL